LTHKARFTYAPLILKRLLITEYKWHAPGIGLVRDDDLRLVTYGFIKK
jgi:hypothetical protein